MRFLKLLGYLLAIAALAVGLLLVLAPLAVEQMKDAIVERLGAAVGEEIRLDSLDLRLLGPRLRLGGLEVGSPRLLSAGEASLSIDVVDSLRRGRLQARANLQDVVLDFSRPSADGEDEPDVSGPGGGLPLPVALEAVVEEAQVLLPDERVIGVGHLAADLRLDAGGAVGGEADAQRVELQWRDQTTLLESLRAAASWRAGLLSVERLRADGPRTEIEAEPAPDAAAEASGIAATRIRLAARLQPVIEFAAASEVEVTGAAAIDLVLRGPFSDPRITADARVEEPAAYGLSFASLDTGISRDAGIWRARGVKLVRPDATLVGDLALDEGTLRLTGDAGWRHVRLGALIDVAALRDTQSSGDAKLQIDLEDLQIEVDGGGRVSGLGGRAIPVSARVTSDGESFAGTASVELDEGNLLRVRVERASAEDLAGTAQLQVSSLEEVLAALGYQGRLPARGGVEANVTLSGTTDDPRATIEATSSDLRLADGTPAALRARARLSARSAEVDTLVLRSGGGSLTAAGTVAFADAVANDWNLRLDDFELEPVFASLALTFGLPLAEISGVVDGRAAVGGPWSTLEASADLSIAEFAVRGVDVGTVDVEAVSQEGRWRAEVEAGVVSALHLVATVRGHGNNVAGIEGKVRDWPLRRLIDGDADLGGVLDADVELTAVGRAADGKVTASLDRLAFGEQDLGSSRIEARGREGAWNVSGELLDGAVDLEAELATTGDLPFEARLRWRKVQIPALTVGDDEVEVESRGLLTLDGALTDLADADAALEVDELSIASQAKRLSSDGPLRAGLRDGALSLEPVRFEGGATKLSLRGDATAGGTGRLVIEGAVGLDWLAYVVPVVEEATGTADLRLTVDVAGGGLASIDGRATLSDAAIEVQGVPPATNLRGSFTFSEKEARIEELRAEVGGGGARVTGVVGLVSGPDLQWSFRDVGLEPIRRLEMILSGEGSLRGGWQEPPLLAGEIAIENLLYDRNLEYQDLIPSFNRAMAPAVRIRREEPSLRFDLRIEARDGMYVENNIANLEARADLRLRGTPNQPSLRGSVEIIDGSVSIRDRSFDIENGVLSFRPDLPGEATIDFVAESIIEAERIPYRITVRVTGTTDDYRIHLESDEGLSQTDIASLIAFGKTVAQMQQGGESGPAIDRLAGIAGGQVGGLLAGEARDVLPFDEIEIRPSYSPSTGQFEPQLRVGKAITADLSAWVGQTFGVQPQTLVEVSYALTQQISTILRWESQTQSQEGAFGGEISQRFDFWGLPGWLQWGDDSDTDGDGE